MGKRGGKGQQGWKERQGATTWDDRSWEERGQSSGYWAGAASRWEKPSPKAPSRAFPSFDTDWKEKNAITVVAERRVPDGPSKTSLAKVVQAAVNLLRKAEGRVSRLNNDLHEKTRRWEAYQAELRTSFIQEYRNYVSTLDRLEQEAVEAASQEVRAPELLAQAMSGVAPEGPSAAANQAWEHLMAGTQEDQTMDTDADAIGRQLEELLGTGLMKGTNPVETAPLKAPGEPPSSGPVRKRPYTAGSPGSARVDPYLVASPTATWRSHSPLPATGEPLHGTSAVHAGPSLGIKASTKLAPQHGQPSSVCLADKLTAARRCAMAPFGKMPGATTGTMAVPKEPPPSPIPTNTGTVLDVTTTTS
eukprot:s6944_g3.t1